MYRRWIGGLKQTFDLHLNITIALIMLNLTLQCTIYSL